MKTIVAIIPARGGSKGVPGKNIAILAGKPLIAWTIEAAKAVSEINRVIVSTDDEKIAAVAKSWGAEVPFLRPADLAQDTTPGQPPIEHALAWLMEKEGFEPEVTVLLQPTSPLRTSFDIEAALKLMGSKNADSVIGITRSHRHPYWTKTLSPDGVLLPFLEDGNGLRRRQDLPEVYDINGLIYAFRTRFFLTHKTWYGPNTYGYLTPQERSLDIDTPFDLKVADLLLRERINCEIPQ